MKRLGPWLSSVRPEVVVTLMLRLQVPSASKSQSCATGTEIADVVLMNTGSVPLGNFVPWQYTRAGQPLLAVAVMNSCRHCVVVLVQLMGSPHGSTAFHGTVDVVDWLGFGHMRAVAGS